MTETHYVKSGNISIAYRVSGGIANSKGIQRACVRREQRDITSSTA